MNHDEEFWKNWLEKNKKIITYNKDGSIDVEGDVRIVGAKVSKILVKFSRVRGHFDCQFNNLTSLENSPRFVNGYFDCDHNKLTTLKGSPDQVIGYFYCSHNLLSSLEYCTKNIEGKLCCSDNNLTTLKHYNGNFGYFYSNKFFESKYLLEHEIWRVLNV